MVDPDGIKPTVAEVIVPIVAPTAAAEVVELVAEVVDISSKSIRFKKKKKII